MFNRYGIYVVPDGVWGDFGASWLGWDIRTGKDAGLLAPKMVEHTKRPRKYGFHGTIKAPFRLAQGTALAELADAARDLATQVQPFSLASLQLARLGSFFALVAPGENAELRAVADTFVTELDRFRAPLNDAELARRRASRLSEQQDAALVKWGYPHVFQDFKFHLTLTGPVKSPDPVQAILDEVLQAPMAQQLVVQDVCLAGEAEDGRFHVIDRFAFSDSVK